jgi:Na+-transporting NADH:ubiquinone oxidoreductase subunit C
MASSVALWRAFLARPNTDRVKTLGVAFLVALVCGLSISIAAVTLRPFVAANVEAERQSLMAAMLAEVPGISEILAEVGEGAVEVMLVDLRTGQLETDIEAAGYDPIAAASDPETSTALSRAEDFAGLGRRENVAPVYVVRRDGAIVLLVLPVRGTGYQSTIKAYLALEGDLNTVAALTVYEQGETPGLGGRIVEPEWQAGWAGKQVASDGEIVIEVVRGDSTGPNEVAGISGASVTGYAITDMIQFWLGPAGYGLFLDRLRAGEDP